MLHGLGGSGAEMLAELGAEGLGEREGIFVVAPDGAMDREGRRFWNAGGACCNFDRTPIDDVARLRVLLDTWRARPEIDPARVYLAGFSNGGFMAHRLACAAGDRLAAFASLAGAEVDEAGRPPCGPALPAAALEVHGDRDPIVRHAGGRVFESPALAPHLSAPATARRWAERLGCTLAPAAPLDLDPLLPGAETRVDRCSPGGRGVAELWTVVGMGHQIVTPGVMQETWRFLARHAKAPAPPRGAPDGPTVR
jgi:polyhydroxybutyrate depolymerase